MEPIQGMARVKTERNRPAYKSSAIFWRRMFFGSMVVLTVVGYMLGMALRGNMALQQDNFDWRR